MELRRRVLWGERIPSIATRSGSRRDNPAYVYHGPIEDVALLGELYEYTPPLNELRIGASIFSAGFLIFALLGRIAIPIMTGQFQRQAAEADHAALPLVEKRGRQQAEGFTQPEHSW